MCLATPMKILRLLDGGRALVGQGGVRMEIDVSLLENPAPGASVIVHAGYAIEVLAPDEAEQRLELFRRMARMAEPDPAGGAEAAGGEGPPEGQRKE